MKRAPERATTSRRREKPPLSVVHLELWVSRRKDRTRMNRTLRQAYRIARRVTQSGGGSGPWVFLVDTDPPDPKTARLRATLGLKPQEDLWLELAFYSSRAGMRSIIARIWKEPQFAVHAAALGGLVTRRKPGYEGILAYARLKPV